MSRSRIYRTEAIVLKSYDYGEADRILTLYTPEDGKLRAIVKGIRRTKSRKAGHLDLFTRSTLLIARGRNLDVITQAETLESFADMRKDLWRASLAQYVAELIDSFTVEGLASQSVYSLMITTLRRLASSSSLDLAVRSFELHLLSLTGYRPQLHHCLGCDTPIRPERNTFSPKLGGVLCPNCAGADAAATVIGIPALKVMRNLQTNENTVLRVGAVGEDVEREVERYLREYITYHLESRPRSINFLDRLRNEGLTV